MKKNLIASLIAVAALALGGAAVAGGPGMHGKHGGGPHIRFEHAIGHMIEKLDLTEDQKEASKKLHEDAKTRVHPLMEQHHQQMEEIHALLDAGTANATEIGEKMIAAHATRKQLEAAHDEIKASFVALLTAEQRAKLEELEEEMPHQRRRIMRF